MTDWPAEFRRYERLASVGQVGGFRPPSTPRTPRPLEGVALGAIFMDLVDLPLDAPNGTGWELRTYPSIDDLVPLLEPEREEPEGEEFAVRPFPVLWRAHTDMPDRDEAPEPAYRDFLDSLADQIQPAGRQRREDAGDDRRRRRRLLRLVAGLWLADGLAVLLSRRRAYRARDFFRVTFERLPPVSVARAITM